MPGMTGVNLLEWVRHNYPTTVRLLMTGFAELEEAVEAINRAQVFRYIFKPWQLEALLESLHMAERSIRLERQNRQLLHELSQTKLEPEDRVVQLTREHAAANGCLEELDRTDPRTGLLNVRGMDELALGELHRRKRYQAPLSLGFVDIDHFKGINDRYLHSTGDR